MPSSSAYVTTGFVDSDEITELPAQQMLASMSNRPALAALNGLISSFPVAKIFTSNSVPIMVYRQQKQDK